VKKKLIVFFVISLFVILASLVIYLVINRPKSSVSNLVEKQIVEIPKFGTTIPQNPESKKINLNSQNGSLKADAYLLRKNERLYVYIYADLPVRLDGSVYKAWLFDEVGNYTFLSDLINRDEQYVLEYESENLEEGKNIVVVTINEQDQENLGEQILIGSI